MAELTPAEVQPVLSPAPSGEMPARQAAAGPAGPESAPIMPQSIELDIGRLSLPPGTIGVQRIRWRIEEELSRLLTDRPATRSSPVDIPPVEVRPGATADEIAAAVAAAIHKEVVS